MKKYIKVFNFFRYETIRLDLTYEKYKQMMSKARKENVPSTPRNLLELAEILDDYLPTLGIYRDCAIGVDGSVSLIFIHDSMIEPLTLCSQLFGDGTFKVCIF